MRPSRPTSRALRETFGDAPIEEVAALGGGASGATVLSLTVAGVGYVLKRPDPTRLAHEERAARETACLTIASARGVAPKLRHVDPATGISILERIDGAQFGRGAPRGPRRIERVARAVRHLHEGPAFPKGPGAPALVHAWDETLRARGMAGLPDGIVSTLAGIGRITRRFAESAPCHNDMNPGNMLETGEAIYFVDWDTAAEGDPFLDLGQLGVFTFSAAAQRAELLEAYLGRAPSDEDRARATLARVMALGLYGAAFACTSMMRGGSERFAGEAVAIPELLRALGEGRATPDVVAASLLAEMQREMEHAEWAAATRALETS